MPELQSITNLNKAASSKNEIGLSFEKGEKFIGKVVNISTDDNEATIKLINGWQFKAKLVDGQKLDVNDVMRFEVEGVQGDEILLKTVKSSPENTDNVEIPDSGDKEVFEKLLIKYNIPATDENIKNIKSFINLKDMADEYKGRLSELSQKFLENLGENASNSKNLVKLNQFFDKLLKSSLDDILVLYQNGIDVSKESMDSLKKLDAGFSTIYNELKDITKNITSSNEEHLSSGEAKINVSPKENENTKITVNNLKNENTKTSVDNLKNENIKIKADVKNLAEDCESKLNEVIKKLPSDLQEKVTDSKAFKELNKFFKEIPKAFTGKDTVSISKEVTSDFKDDVKSLVKMSSEFSDLGKGLNKISDDLNKINVNYEKINHDSLESEEIKTEIKPKENEVSSAQNKGAKTEDISNFKNLKGEDLETFSNVKNMTDSCKEKMSEIIEKLPPNLGKQVSNSKIVNDLNNFFNNVSKSSDKDIPSLCQSAVDIPKDEMKNLLKADNKFSGVNNDFNEIFNDLKKLSVKIQKSSSDVITANDVKNEMNLKQNEIKDMIKSLLTNGNMNLKNETMSDFKLYNELSNNYYYMDLPLNMSGKQYDYKLIIKDDRGRGKRIDSKNVKIAVKVKTNNIGTVEAYIKLFENKFNVELKCGKEFIYDLNKDISELTSKLEDMGFETITLVNEKKDEMNLSSLQNFFEDAEFKKLDVMV